MRWLQALGCLIVLLVNSINCNDPVWRWECMKGYCQKLRITPETKDSAISLPACRLFCANHAGLWPQPTGKTYVGNTLLHVDVNQIETNPGKSDTPISSLVHAATERFIQQVKLVGPKNSRSTGGSKIRVRLEIANPDQKKLTLETDESYVLKVSAEEDVVNVVVQASTFFGSRHGLETLGQLIIYDDIRGEYQMPKDVLIEDKPIYPYRGVLLDTARNYISVDTIKKTMTGMAASKLNTFHWHITDTHSFPYVSKSQPKLSQIGAYTSSKIYTPEDVAEVVQYGKELGIRVLPEFDAPAHVGEGWQDTDFVACFNKQPWNSYCVEPPCGQFDPTKPKLYDALEGIYKDMVEQFDPDIFHMGGDEVSLSCWNSTENIVKWMAEKGYSRNEAGFMKLWDLFQSQALTRFYNQRGKEIPIIMWTSTLTKPEYVAKYLPNDKYIIQVWTSGYDYHIKELLGKNYKLILSNYDALYLDCGFAGWVQDGNNWCSPYIGWQKVYSNSPAEIAGLKKHLILGAEAALWTEQVDDTSVDSRLWPRAAAMAERLWAEPNTTWRDAEPRMLVHRERLVQKGISADALEPQWCLQNEEHCPTDGANTLREFIPMNGANRL